jgi:hypothetical protein
VLVPQHQTAMYETYNKKLSASDGKARGQLNALSTGYWEPVAVQYAILKT